MDDFTKLLNHILFLARRFPGYSDEYILKIILLELSAPTRKPGFDYLVDAILIYHGSSMSMISKEIYPEICKKYGIYVRPPQVEGTLRGIINSAWKHRDKQIWQCYFSNNKKKPTNLEFVSRLSRVLELWEECCEQLASEKEGNGV